MINEEDPNWKQPTMSKKSKSTPPWRLRKETSAGVNETDSPKVRQMKEDLNAILKKDLWRAR